jgi:hypothetical protein
MGDIIIVLFLLAVPIGTLWLLITSESYREDIIKTDDPCLGPAETPCGRSIKDACNGCHPGRRREVYVASNGCWGQRHIFCSPEFRRELERYKELEKNIRK